MDRSYIIKIGKLITAKPRTKAGFSTALIHEPKDIHKRNYGSLYFVMEIASPSPKTAEVGKSLIEIISEEYYRELGRDALLSFEAALKRANQYLGDLAEEGEVFWLGKLNATISCLYKNNLHLTATGSAEAHLLRGDILTNLSEGLFTPGETPDPLKTFANITSGQLQIGDKLILASPSLFYNLSYEELKRLVGEASPPAAVGELASLLEEEEDSLGVSLIILELQKEEPQKVEEKEEEIFLKPKREKVVLGKAKSVFLALAKRAKKATHLYLIPLLKKLIPVAKRGGGAFLVLISRLKTASQGLIKSLKRPSFEIKKPSFLSSLGREILVVFSFLKRHLQSFFSDLKTLRLSDFRRGTEKRYLIIFLISLVLLGLSITAMVIKEREGRLQAKYEAALEEAFNKEASARSSLIYGDRSQAKKFLEEAQALASDLQKIGYQKDKVEGLLVKIQADWDLVWGILRVQPKLLADFGSLKSGLVASGLYYLGGDFYTLGEKEIYKSSLEGRSLQAIPFAETLEGNLKFAMVGENEFLIYSDVSQIWRFNPQRKTLEKVSLPLGISWEKANSGAFYLDYLYLLSPEDNQIYRHFRTYPGYSKGGKYVLSGQDVDLGDALSITISNFPYVLKKSGAVLKFSRGKLLDFRLKGLSPSFRNPKEIYTRGGLENIYITDPENKRIVIVDSEGNFIKQLKAEEFSDLSGIWVGKDEKTIYLLSSGKLFSVNL